MSSKNFRMFIKLVNGSHFFLNQAFKHINLALEEDLTARIFAEKIRILNPRSVDIDECLQEYQNNPVMLLQSEDLCLLDDKTHPVYLALEQSKIEAKDGSKCFTTKHKIESHELLGHINNFSFFIESLINRHILFLKADRRIDEFCYNRLENSSIMGKLIFILKDNAEKKKVSLEKIHNLFGHRNKTVHLTPKNADSLKIKIIELIQIWKDSIHLMQHLHAIEQFGFDDFGGAIKNKMSEFENRWIK